MFASARHLCPDHAHVAEIGENAGRVCGAGEEALSYARLEALPHQKLAKSR
jgi:hypothetical protein